MTLSAEFCSRRFDFLRLHNWAWERALLKKTSPIDVEREEKTIWHLLRRLIAHFLKQKRIEFVLRINNEQEQIEILFPQSIQIIKGLMKKENMPGKLRWIRDNKQRTHTLIIPIKNYQIWCASGQFRAFEELSR